MNILPFASHHRHDDFVAGFLGGVKIRLHLPQSAEGVTHHDIAAILHRGDGLILTPLMRLLDFVVIIAAIGFKPLVSFVVVRDSERFSVRRFSASRDTAQDDKPWPNQSPEPTRIGAVSCPQGFQWFHITGSGWLSFFR